MTAPEALAAGMVGADGGPTIRGQRIFKIIVIGDSNVGKTCLTFRFCEGKFPEKTEATIGVDFREKNLAIGSDVIKLQIWDTAGQERFRKSMVQHYYRNVHAVVFMYDVTKMSSFESLPSWIEECDAYNLSKEIPRILVGNKCDVKEKVAVSTGTAQRFADVYQMPLFETSAKDSAESDHVESIFMTLAHKLKNSKPMMSANMYSLATQATQQNPALRLGSTERLSTSEDSGYCQC